MAILKSLMERGEARRQKVNRLYISQAGNCCGAQVISGFHTTRQGEEYEYTDLAKWATVSSVLHRLMTDLRECALNPDDEGESYEDYDEDMNEYVTSYPDGIETVQMQPAIVTAYLANRQIPQWHQTLIDHGFTLMVEGATNSKSLGGIINMYVGEMPTSRKYGKAMGRPNARMPRGLKATKGHGYDRHLAKEPA